MSVIYTIAGKPIVAKALGSISQDRRFKLVYMLIYEEALIGL